MSATLKLTHETIGVEVRRGTYDVVLDGKPAGSLELNDPIEISVGETVAFRCGGKRILPIFLLSFAVPSLALSLHRV